MYFDKNFKNKETPTKIIDGLYLGNVDDSSNLEKLQKKGIKYILVAGNHLNLNFPEEFTYKLISINDDPRETIETYFQETHEFIKKGIEFGGCLVHCAAGVSRSASFVIAFIMKENSMNLNQAFKLVFDQRPIIYPNYGFQLQLKKYEVEIGLSSKEEFKQEVDKGRLYFIDDDLYG